MQKNEREISGVDIKKRQITELMHTWLHDLDQADPAPRTLRRYERVVQHFLDWYIQQEHRAITPDDFTPIAFTSYRRATQTTMATATVNLHLCALRRWCAWMVDHQILVTNPLARIKGIRQQRVGEPNDLTDSAINALLREAQRSRHPLRDYAILQLMVQTGMRIGECQALNWHDLTLSEKRGTVMIRAGKGNKCRIVPLNGSARAALTAYAAPLLGVPSSLKAVALAWTTINLHDRSKPLWQSQKGNRLSATALWGMIHGLICIAAARNLVPANTTPHMLRHTFARRYLTDHPGDLIGLARLLGHSDLNTTSLYTQPTAEELAQRVDDLSLNAYH
ncbi:tyrosine-type recombinase/integrase [Herpetosiphon llansteffanensis]|uniref:tyrosine-type recombinase/integrase n=1 Tax=Herpetosiphon llansteffanensis TaxID=2094568 RepID=UPI0013DFA9E2|nr:tyrosine-type recombinase/integrase [Herpetosiphon llansteffanensis]